MTLEELHILKEIIQFARGKAYSVPFSDKIFRMEKVIDREIKLKHIDKDVSGNEIRRDE